MRYIAYKSSKGFNMNEADGTGWYHTTSCYAPSLHYRLPDIQGPWSAYPIWEFNEKLVSNYGTVTDNSWFNMLQDFSKEGIAKDLEVH